MRWYYQPLLVKQIYHFLITQHACCLYNLFLYCFCCVETAKDNKWLKAFGNNLKKLRQDKGLTQANLAFEANLSESQIQRIEYGNHNFSILTLLALSKALEVSPSKMLELN